MFLTIFDINSPPFNVDKWSYNINYIENQ